MTHNAFVSICLGSYFRPVDLVDPEDEIPDEGGVEDCADKGLFFEMRDDDLSDKGVLMDWTETLSTQIGFLGEVDLEDELDGYGNCTGRKRFVLTIPKGRLRKVASDEMEHFKAELGKTSVDEFCGAKFGNFYELAKMVSNDGWQDSIIDTSADIDNINPEPWFSWVGCNLLNNDKHELRYRVIAIFDVSHD